MSNDELLFQQWWIIESPPGTFDKAQCKVAFFAGLRYARAYEPAEQIIAGDVATGLHCEHGYSFDCPEGCEDACTDPPRA